MAACPFQVFSAAAPRLPAPQEADAPATSRIPHPAAIKRSGYGPNVAAPDNRRSRSICSTRTVFERIGTHRQIIAVGLEIEQDAGALVDAAGNTFEAHRDLAVPEIINVLGHRVWEIRIGLDAIEKLPCTRNIGRRGGRDSHHHAKTIESGSAAKNQASATRASATSG